jgi:hypothetical protein
MPLSWPVKIADVTLEVLPHLKRKSNFVQNKQDADYKRILRCNINDKASLVIYILLFKCLEKHRVMHRDS